jgi:hypothetical protein
LAKRFGAATAQEIRIQYGGSVTPDTVDALMSQKDIDGALVGGASLNAASFEKLVKFKAVPLSPVAQLYDAIGRTTKSVVVTAAALSMVISKSWMPIYYVVGGLVNAVLSKLLKMIIRQPRPSTAVSLTEYGMPSSHSQSLFYFSTILLSKFGYRRPLLASVLALYTLTAASWRVSTGLHTVEQTAVGAVVGAAMGLAVEKFLPTALAAVKTIVSAPIISKIVGNRFIALNLLLAVGGLILYGPEIKNTICRVEKK